MDSKSAEEICVELQIDTRLLSQWKEQFLAHAGVIFEHERVDRAKSEQIAELERMIVRLRMELEATKKEPAAVHAPTRRNVKSQRIVQKKG
jgi:hypothetical protein